MYYCKYIWIVLCSDTLNWDLSLYIKNSYPISIYATIGELLYIDIFFLQI